LRFAAIGSLTLLVATLTACVRPSAVARYAESAGRTTAEFPALARDIHASCLRFEAYKAQRSGDGWYEEAGLRRACASRDTAVAGLIATNRVLGSYLGALGALAEDRVTSTDWAIERLSSALVGKAGLDDAQVSAVQRLANYVSSAALEGYRRRELVRAITSRNADVQTVTLALRTVISRDFRAALDVESRALTDFYRSALAEHSSREPLAAILVREQRDRRAVELAEKRDAIASYLRALENVRAGHQRLYEGRRHIDAPRVAADLLKNADELDSIARQLERAFR
jgi:hypothetical protein